MYRTLRKGYGEAWICRPTMHGIENSYYSKNAKIREIYDRLKRQGDKQLFFLSSEAMIGRDGEACVDGIHFTDLGFQRYAELLYPIIKKRMIIK